MKTFLRRIENPTESATSGNKPLFEDVTFLATVALASIVSAVGLSVAFGHLWPLILIGGSNCLGAAWGVVRFKNSFDQAYVLVNSAPRLTRGARPVEWKEAA